MRDAAFDLPAAPSACRQPLTDEALLRTLGLVFEAGGERLLDGVDISIRQGSRTLIMGPNGAGKSMLLKLLHGLLTPQQGDVLWKGEPLSK